MQDFLSVRNCPKCNEERFTTSHSECSGGCFCYAYHVAVIDEEMNSCFMPSSEEDPEPLVVEHLDVTCNRCGYSWVENTADKTEKVE